MSEDVIFVLDDDIVPSATPSVINYSTDTQY